MLMRTGVALATVMLVLPLTVVAQKSGRSRSSSSRSSAKSTSSKPTSTSTGSRKSSIPKKSTVAKRSGNGRIKRSSSARADFMRQTDYPKGRNGYVVDDILPLECGGADVPSNMQWQTVQESKIKDRSERDCRRE